MAKRDKPLVRPLSPYMQYVNTQTIHTMGFSILHRITGLALSVGSLVLAYWLVAAASGPDRYSAAQAVLASGWMKVLLIGWAFAFWYHFLNGIRHLFWDSGRGFELKTSRNSGYSVLIGALVLTVVLVCVFARTGGAV